MREPTYLHEGVTNATMYTFFMVHVGSLSNFVLTATINCSIEQVASGWAA